ncbi:SDR family oxidoreductase [Halorarius halobius]|uniref:SDR family oxidoreductase n=1 Tax=Halorarius halobius TaxID=2962671 RepID=UPI0020CD78CB|nr:SDR family oxidoreductase [Halorarius halobius]
MATQLPLQNSVSFITGASSGIGKATGHALAHDGADVALLARREERLRSVAAEIEDEHDVETLIIPADVGDESQVEAAIDLTVDTFGRIDVVVSNAGVPGSDNQPLPEVDLEDYRTLMRVNVDGTFYVAHNAIPHLADVGGNLIFVGSFDGHYPRTRSPTYAASKWWVRGFAHSLAGPAGEQGIGVTVVNPAKVRTEIGRSGEPSFKERFEPGEVLEPSDVAQAIAFAARQERRATISELDIYTRDKYSREGF